MRLTALIAALAALSACSDWSMDAPTAEQIAIARYLCTDTEGAGDALAAYLAARGQVVSDLALPDVGPERDLYCALRGDRIAALPLPAAVQ